MASAVTIMPVGDSITAQADPTSYIRYLDTNLKKLGANPSFVGSQNGVVGFHEGHPGFRIDQLDVVAYLAANPAQIVLLHAGTNDIYAGGVGGLGSVAVTRMGTLLDAVWASRPWVHVIVSKIITMKGSAAVWIPQIINFHDGLVDLIRTKQAAGKPVTLVDSFTGFTPSMLNDDLHPTDTGADFIANRFLIPLKGMLPRDRNTSLDFVSKRSY